MAEDRATDGERPVATQRVASASLGALLSLGASAVLTAALLLVLTRELSRAQYGLFAIALSVHQIAFLLTDLGTTPASAKKLADARHQPGELAAVAGSAAFTKGATALAGGGVLFVLAPGIAAAYADPRLTPILRVTAAVLILSTSFQLARLALNAIGRTWQMCLVVLIESAAEVAACLALVLAVGSATSATAGRVAGFGIGCIVGFYLLYHAVGGFARPRRRLVQALLRSGLLLGLTEVTYVLFTQIDILLIGALLGAASVTLFEPAVRLVVLGGFIGFAVALASTPRLASTRDRGTQRRQLLTPLTYVLCLQGALSVVWVILVAPNAVLIFGKEFHDTSAILYLLTPYLFLSGPAALLSSATIFLGNAHRRLIACLLALGVNAMLDVILLPSWGIRAAAFGTNVGVIIYVTLYARLCSSLLHMPIRDLLSPLWRAVTCAALAAALGYACSLIDPSRGVLSSAVAIIFYTQLLVMMRVLTSLQLRTFLQAARRPSTLRGAARP